jgi:ribonucleoside-diphosphate reductase alpha chain
LVKNVIKRSGKTVEFKPEKIKNAISNVFEETDNKITESQLDRVTSYVVEKIEEEDTVESIQDKVETTLLDCGYIEEARKYIHYREKHNRQRKQWVNEGLPLSIWKRKYQFRNETFEEFFDRVSGGNEKIRKIIKNKEFLPAGRILANRGLQEHGLKVTYSNCYVTSPPEDNLESIVQKAGDLARTYSYGGGAGIDISKLRPQGSKVHNAAKTTSGAPSFMGLYDEISSIIGMKGRRAALMISLDVSHPDIEQFIEKKLDLDSITKANISIKVTDDFMEAVKNNEKYTLSFHVEDTGEDIEKEVDASKIFNKLAYGNWFSSEPGTLFWDKIKNYSILQHYDDFEFAGTNPCGEEPLPSGGSCLLGAINLAKFVNDEFENNVKFNYDKFKKVIKESVVALNEILDEGLELHPLKEQRDSVRNWRQIGLGIMGLSDMLIKLKIRYGSEEALRLLNKIGRVFANEGLKQSALLAKQQGTFPKYDKESTLKSSYLKEVADKDTLDLIEKHGLRNSQLFTVAPTGSISNLCEVSGGIEPIFKTSYIRKTESLHNEEKEYKVFTPIIEKVMENENIEDENNLPNYVTDAHKLNYIERIKMQSIWQKYTDASISSTVNLDNEATVEDIKDLYMKAWEYGLKGITVYRDGCARGAILRGEEETGSKTEMTEQDWIDMGICPDCKSDLSHVAGCEECTNCGWGKCAI